MVLALAAGLIAQDVVLGLTLLVIGCPGALVIGVLSNGLNLIGVNSFWQYVAKGVVILLAVYLDIYRKRKERF